MSFFWPTGPIKRNSTHEGATATAASPPENAESPPMKEHEDTAHDRALRELGIVPGNANESEQPHSVHVGSEGHFNSNHRGSEKQKRDVSGSMPSAAFPLGPEEIYDPATGLLAGFVRQNGTSAEDAAAFRSPPPTGAVQSPRSASGGTRASPPFQGVHGSTTTFQGMQEVLSQQQQKNGNTNTSGAHQSPQNKSATLSEDMWNQLSKIRVLQSEIARMHLALDKPGIIEGVKSRRGTAGTGVARGDTSDTLGISINRAGAGAGTGLDNISGTAGGADQPTVPEDEFAKRKASIGAIMAKLDALSVAVTEFHTLPAPPLDFPSPSSATSSRANSLQPSFGLDRDNRRRKLFSEPSLMSGVSTTRPPSVDAKDHVQPSPPSALVSAAPKPVSFSARAGNTNSNRTDSGVGTTPLPSSSPPLATPAVQRRHPSPLTISTSTPRSREPKVELSQSSSRYTPPLARPQPQNSRGQGQRLETLHEPLVELSKPSSEATQTLPPTPIVPVERVIDGIPTGNFRVTSRHESPLGTPTSLLRRAVPLPEEAPIATTAATAGGGNGRSEVTGSRDDQKRIDAPAASV